MKRYIFLSAMLVLAFGLNAQRTNPGSRTVADEKKSDAVKTETRQREATPARTEVKTENKEEKAVRTSAPDKRVEPVKTESRNRETPAVRTETPPQRTVNQEIENRPINPARSRTVAPSRSEQAPDRNDNPENRETERKVGNSNSNNRTSGNRNSSYSGSGSGNRRVAESREPKVETNRQYVPRTEQVYVEKRRTYRTPDRPRYVRTVNTNVNYVNRPVEYRRSYFPYPEPRRIDIIWDVRMYNEYRYLYPHYDYWYYPYGYRIQTISAYDADRFVGEVARIYGRVYEVWYERQTDEFTLYFGNPYPYQDFSVILPGKLARRYSYRPERYFTNRNVAVTGLISLWENKPEILIKKRSQVDIYF